MFSFILGVDLGVDDSLLILECHLISVRADSDSTSTWYVPTHLGSELINLGSQSKVNQKQLPFMVFLKILVSLRPQVPNKIHLVKSWFSNASFHVK